MPECDSELYAAAVGYLIGFAFIFFILLIVGLGITHTKRNKQIAAVIAAVLAAAPMIAIYVSNQKKVASYRVVVRTFKQLPGQYVRVYLNVTNVSKLSGIPDCSVSIQPTNPQGDPIGGGGVNAGTLNHAIPAGATNYTFLDVLVAGNDAHLVTSRSMITASCT